MLVLLLGAGCADDPGVCGDFEVEEGVVCLSERATSTRPALVLGDIGPNGRTDAVVYANDEGTHIAVQRGQFDGTFSAPGPATVFPARPLNAAVGDSDGDGVTDVLLRHAGVAEQQICSYTIDLGDALVEQWCVVTGVAPSGYDGHPAPLWAGAFGPGGQGGFALISRDDVLFVLDPSGIATQIQVPRSATTVPGGDVEVADLDGDGQQELLLSADGVIDRLAAPFDGTLQIAAPDAVGFYVGDLDGDGIDDLILRGAGPAGTPTPVELRLSDGTTSSGTFPAASGYQTWLTADLDGDHRDELMARGPDDIHIVWGHAVADGRPLQPKLLEAGIAALTSWPGIDAIDIDGNGVDDLVLSLGDDTPQLGFFPWRVGEVWVSEP